MSDPLSAADRAVAMTRSILLRHLTGSPPSMLVQIMPDDACFATFPRTPISHAAQQFLLALRGQIDAPQPDSDADTIVRPSAASSSSSPPIINNNSNNNNNNNNNSNDDDENKEGYWSDSSGVQDNNDQEVSDLGSDIENIVLTSDDDEEKASESDAAEETDESDSNARVLLIQCRRYTAKLQRKMRVAAAIESRRESNQSRKQAYDWYRRKMKACGAPEHSIEKTIRRASRYATERRKH